MSAIHGVEGLIKWIKGDKAQNDSKQCSTAMSAPPVAARASSSRSSRI